MKSDQEPRPDDPSNAAPRKKYEKPQLQVYGDLAEIAKTLASQTKPDGSGHPNKHFTN